MARRHGEPERARTLAERLLTRRERDPDAWATLAMLTRERTPAIEAIEKALALAPKRVDLHRRKAQILAQHGDHAGAHAAFAPPPSIRSRWSSCSKKQRFWPRVAPASRP